MLAVVDLWENMCATTKERSIRLARKLRGVLTSRSFLKWDKGNSDILKQDTGLRSTNFKTQGFQPSLFQREAPYFVNIFVPFSHPNLATSLFLASFVPLKLHVILKNSLFFVWILPIFRMLMLASLRTPLMDRQTWRAMIVDDYTHYNKFWVSDFHVEV